MKKIIVVFLFVFTAGVAFFLNSEKNVTQVAKEPVAALTPMATPTPPTSVIEVHSADGEANLIMKKTGINPAYFSFFVTSENLNNQLVFAKSTMDSYFILPANSWSPDNKQFFIHENRATGSSYLVFKENGDNFSDGSKYVDVSNLFTQKIENYTLSEVTGWDGPGLLHVLTSGPSFWFDIGNRAFLQLAR